MNNDSIGGGTLSGTMAMPWEDRPQGCTDPLWRYSANPIIPRDQLPFANSIFNSAVIRHKDRFIGVFRVDYRTMDKRLHLGYSADGLSWNIDQKPIRFADGGEASGYDPRLVALDGAYYITWCCHYHGPTIGVAVTRDFERFERLENAFLPFNRNGVLFPEKITGRFAMLSRPSDNGHTPFGDIYYSESPDMTYWGRHRHVMAAAGGWAWTKVGAGPAPIKIEEGWLLIYHGVQTTCSGMIYSMGGAILDGEKPWVVKHRCRPYLLSPRTPYECVGDVPNVLFPCAALHDPDDGRLAVYYGAADTAVALAFGRIEELVAYIKGNDAPELRQH